MRLPKISLAGTITGIVLVAIWLAVLHEDLTDENEGVCSHAHFLVIGVMPMACLLTWALLMGVVGLIRRGSMSPFLIGFELAGWGTLFLIVLHDDASDAAIWSPIGLASPLLLRLFPGGFHNYHEYEILLTHFVIFLTPPLIASLLGGWLVSRSGIRLVWRDGNGYGPE